MTGRPVMAGEMKVEEVDHRPESHTVDDVAEGTGKHKPQGKLC